MKRSDPLIPRTAKLLKDGFTVLTTTVAYHHPQASLCKAITPSKQHMCVAVRPKEK